MDICIIINQKHTGYQISQICIENLTVQQYCIICSIKDVINEFSEVHVLEIEII